MVIFIGLSVRGLKSLNVGDIECDFEGLNMIL